MSHPTVSPKLYLAVYAALLGLTGTTVWLSLQELGAWEIPIALGIAASKTILVALFFMHLLHSPRLVWLIVAGGVVFLGIMMLGTLADYLTRDWLYPWPKSP
jgi:cytochrome c oxidase subunit 4